MSITPNNLPDKTLSDVIARLEKIKEKHGDLITRVDMTEHGKTHMLYSSNDLPIMPNDEAYINIMIVVVDRR